MHQNSSRTSLFARLSLSIALLWIPGMAQALGLGKLTLHSGLDEPLNAEIELTAVQSNELKTLKTGLASRADFENAGIERAPHLAGIKYMVVQRSDGRYFLLLTTDQSIREPFLHFLLQVDWVGGHLIREYTALVDPPYLVAGKPSGITTPQSAPPEPPPPPVAVEAAPAPVRVEPRAQPFVPPPVVEKSPAAEPLEGKVDIAAERSEAISTPFAPIESAAPAEKLLGPPNVREEDVPTEYGPVKKGETLWKIVSQLRTDKNLTAPQVMLALLKTNRDAFFNNNVNNLKTGKILKIPESSLVESTSASRALKEFRAQYDVWQEYKLKLAGAGNVTKVAAVEKNSSKGQITAEKPNKETAPAGKDKKAAAAPSPEKDTVVEDLLKIVRAKLDDKADTPAQKKSDKENKQTGTDAGKAAVAERRSLQDKVAVLEETLESKQMENKELRERVNQIETQLKNTKRLIELENKQLAQAQKQASGNKVDAAAVKPDNNQSKESSTKPAAAGTAPGAGKNQAKPSDAKQPAAAASPAAQKPAAAEKKDSAPSAQDAVQIIENLSKTIKNLSQTIENLLSDLLADTFILSLVGGGIAIIAGGMLLAYSRRRRHSIAEFEESILSGGGLNSEGNMGDTARRAENVDASFLSDFSQGGMGNIHTDEVDPIAEAEVYLAYGRDEQAEEILKEAVVKDPGRHELRQKLLEIYHQRNDLASFETVAEELYAALEGKGGKIWQKVEELGKKMNPQNPLFRGGKPARPVAGEKKPQQPLASGAAGGAAGLSSKSAPGATAPKPTPPEPGLNFDLDRPAGGTAAAPGELSFDLDFGAGNAETAASADSIDFSQTISATAADDAGMGSSVEPSPGIDLDFSVLAKDAAAADRSAVSAGIDFESSIASSEDIELSFGPDTPAKTSNESNEIQWSLDSAPVTPDGIAFESVGEIGEDNNMDNSQVDEAATKLDLAKAYIDMGDAEGARSILDEVLAEGNEKQKKQAAELAAQIP